MGKKLLHLLSTITLAFGIALATASPALAVEKSETISLEGKNGQGLTYTGSKFQVLGEGNCLNDGIEIVFQQSDMTLYGMVISSRDNTAIKKVYLHFSLYDDEFDETFQDCMHKDTIFCDPGKLGTINKLGDDTAEATIENVNASSVRVWSVCEDVKNLTGRLGPQIDKVTVYYDESPVVPTTTKTLTVKGKTAKVSAKKLAKKNQTLAVSKVLTIKNATGTKKFVKKSGNKKITINKKTGKVTIKKGLKKGTYKVKVAVTASKKTKTTVFKINVK